MAKQCKELFSGMDCTFIGDETEPVTGLAYRSDKVCPGDAFFCVTGLKVDGHTFAQEAIDRGAKVLVAERPLYLIDATDVTVVMVRDSRKAMAYASANYYDDPSSSFDLVGITGTNGKTTTTYLVEHIVREVGKRSGLIGTVGIHIGDEQERAVHTTPEACDLQRLFARLREGGCEVVAMEVSSHALDLSRTAASHFAVTTFTNLTRDHLDYHKTFESYFAAKARLFSREYPAKRVICIDGEWGSALYRRCREAGDDIITTGFTHDALIHPLEVHYSYEGTEIVLDVCGEARRFFCPLVGKFNVENVMSAFASALQVGIDQDTIAKALGTAPSVPGRLERVDAPVGKGVSVFVDYAHTPDALEKVIRALRAVSDGRLIVVFGCGGDRDASKRSIMGSSSLLADFVVVTSDNPRHEDPLAIIEDIRAGLGSDEERYAIEPDRRSAIALALEKARSGDCVLIAGKGHEDYQIVGDETFPFDDRLVAAEEMNRIFG